MSGVSYDVWLRYLCAGVSWFEVSVNTLQSPINISSPTPLSPILPVSTRLMAILLLQTFSITVGQSKWSYESFEMSYFYDFDKTQELTALRTEFCWAPGHNSLNPIQLGLSRENRVE
jgi:hypothetical protein